MSFKISFGTESTAPKRPANFQNSARYRSGFNFDCASVCFSDPSLQDGSLWEIPAHLLEKGERLGAGAFGDVFAATMMSNVAGGLSRTVALKTLRPDAAEDDGRDFLAEISLMLVRCWVFFVVVLSRLLLIPVASMCTTTARTRTWCLFLAL